MRGEDTPRRKAFPDTSVVYPVPILDLLMSLAEAFVHQLVAAKRARKIEGLTTATLVERWRAAGLTAFHAALVDALNA